MNLREIFESAVHVWSRAGGKQTRKYRCTSGPRKGRVMSSPSACNKPINQRKSASLKKTKMSKSAPIKIKTARTRKTNPAAMRLPRLNKPKRKKI